MPTDAHAQPFPADHGALPPWRTADLPAPPPFNFRNLTKVIGPGAIMAATSIGGGEWLVGPAAAVKYSSAIFLIATVAIALQVIFNLEAIRYTLYTGEPIYGGIMRLKPGPRFWAGFYTVLGFFQVGWPALAGSAAATLLGAWMGRMPGAPDQATQGWIAVALILAVVCILSFGGTVERMLEYFAWTMLGVVFLFLMVVNVVFVPAAHRWETLLGFFSFTGLPPRSTGGLIGALAATAGSGGNGQPHGHQLGARQGLRHGRHGRRHPERRRRPRDPAVARRDGVPGHAGEPGALARVDALRARRPDLGVGPVLLRRDVPERQPGHGHHPARHRPAGAGGRRLPGQVPRAGFGRASGSSPCSTASGSCSRRSSGNTDILVRTVTDALWMSSPQRRDGCPASARSTTASWSSSRSGARSSIRSASPFQLFKIVANMAGVVLMIAGVQILIVNRRFLPPAVRPPLWREAGLLACSAFYAFFAYWVARDILGAMF